LYYFIHNALPLVLILSQINPINILMPYSLKLSLYQAVETHRVVRRVHSWPIDGGEVVSLRLRPTFILRKIPGVYFC
jgi:hypothetical protein